MPGTTEGVRLNIVGLETPWGFRTIELFQGDLSSDTFRCDLLVVSAFAGSYLPTPGTVIKALRDNRGVDLSKESGQPAFDLRKALGVWVTRTLPEQPFKQILVLEMIGTSLPITECISNAFAAVAALNAKGSAVRTMAMPVLGAGSQGIPPDKIMSPLLETAAAALRRDSTLERVVFVELDGRKASQLAEAMDRTLRRAKVSLPKTELLLSLRADLRRDLDHASAAVRGDRRQLFDEMRRLIDNDASRSFEIGLAGRRLVEFVVDDLIPARSGDLAQRIDQVASLKVASWIRGYMHTLRILGNESAHQNAMDGRIPPFVNEDDLAVCLFCCQRILNFWLSLPRSSG